MRLLRSLAAARKFARDALAGSVGAVVVIANIVSFGALMFPGDLSAGASIAIWAMLIGSGIAGVWIALTTTLPPLATGIDSPTGAVLVLLSATVASAISSPQIAIQTVMLLFSAASVIIGALLLTLGARRWGLYFRFVPYFVVGAFLAATGWFLVAGGVRMATGKTLGVLADGWTADEAMKLSSTVAVLLVLLALRRWIKTPFALPAALLAMWLAGAAILFGLRLSASEHGWYFPSLGTLLPWSPFEAAQAIHFTWSMTTLRLVLELFAVAIVALLSLVTKVASIEVARQTSGDLDRELRAHGLATLVAAPFGGLTSNLQTGTSRLLEHAGGATRMSGVVCALAVGGVGLTNFDVLGAVPIPIVAGLVLYLGYTFFVDALWRPYVQRAWLDFGLAISIMIVCINYGYLVGVLIGILCACVLFAISYARIGVVRRHITRAQFASYVDRAAPAARYLQDAGDAIQIYWLSGYIFFGSSEGVFERIRSDIEALSPRRVAYVILDFGLVTGGDSSVGVSLTKLRNFCRKHGTTLVYASVSPRERVALERGGFLGGSSQHQAFADLNHALAWCEDQLLAKAKLDVDTGLTGFEGWLREQLGADLRLSDIESYFECKSTQGSQVLYRQGDPADTVDLIAAGDLVVDIATAAGESLRVRRLKTHTVVGEMGFFRRTLRSATVSSDGPATLFTLTRDNFERMRRERPDLASAFDDFIVRVLAERLDLANRAVTALAR